MWQNYPATSGRDTALHFPFKKRNIGETRKREMNQNDRLLLARPRAAACQVSITKNLPKTERDAERSSKSPKSVCGTGN
jgi:hypothetical protein